jgi:hypothetical protein
MKHPEGVGDYLEHSAWTTQRTSRYIQDLDSVATGLENINALIRNIEIIRGAANRSQNKSLRLSPARPR